MDFRIAQSWRSIIITVSLMVTVSAVVRRNYCGEEEISCTDANETCILRGQECDGEIDCPNANDEQILLCRQIKRPMLELAFLCSNRYTRTIYPVELCHPLCLRLRHPDLCFYAMMTMYEKPVGTCSIPDLPDRGTYEVIEAASYADISLYFTCQEGYDLLGSQYASCENGVWQEMPTCKKLSGWEVEDEDLRK